MGVSEGKKGLAEALEKISGAEIVECSAALADALKRGNKILIAGNGGSAADAQHFAAELVCTFEDRGRKALPAYALTTNSSVMSAWANDFSFDSVFSRQVEALGSRGDALVSITTSGKSKNILLAMEKAREKGLKNILLSGKGGGDAAKLADIAIIVDSSSTPRIQECHIFCIHEICAILDREFKDEK
ncbi:MAG: SIS domain-containing protein [Candidatus Micrarchaeia archaeon]